MTNSNIFSFVFFFERSMQIPIKNYYCFSMFYGIPNDIIIIFGTCTCTLDFYIIPVVSLYTSVTILRNLHIYAIFKFQGHNSRITEYLID